MKREIITDTVTIFLENIMFTSASVFGPPKFATIFDVKNDSAKRHRQSLPHSESSSEHYPPF